MRPFYWILSVGLLVRLVLAWNSPLYVDEAFTYALSLSNPSDLLLSATLDNHPPLFPLFSWAWSSFSSDPFWLRLPAIAAWTISLTYFWRLASLVHPKPWLPTLGYSLSYGLWVSQTVYRANSAFEAAFLVALWALYQDLERRSNGNDPPPTSWEAWFALILLPQLNYLGVIPLAYVTVRAKGLRQPALASWLLTGLMLGGVRLVRGSVEAIPGRQTGFEWWRVLFCPFQDLGLEALFLDQGTNALQFLAGLACVLWIYSLWSNWQNRLIRESLAVWCSLLIVLEVLGYLKGGGWLQSRYLVFFGGVIWLSWGGSNPRVWPILFGPVISVGLWASIQGPFDRTFWTQDWQTVAQFVRQRAKPSDAICVYPAYGLVALGPALGTGVPQFAKGTIQFPPTIPLRVPLNDNALTPQLEKLLAGRGVILIFNQEQESGVREWFSQRYLVVDQLTIPSRRQWGYFEIYQLQPKTSP